MILIITGVAIFFAWPRKDDARRLVGAKNKNPSATNAVPTVPVTRTMSNDSVLTVSGYIVNRERIELSPRFLGVVKWIGVKKGDAVTNGQVVVLLDDSEQKARVAEALGRLTNAMSRWPRQSWIMTG